MQFIIRSYRSADVEEMAQLFYHTVHHVNAADYAPGQLQAWASGRVDLAAWDASFRAHTTLVARRMDGLSGLPTGMGADILTGCMCIRIIRDAALLPPYAIAWRRAQKRKR